MANLTPNLGLFKYDPLTDQNEAFSFEQALNDNWDILDEKCGSQRNIGEIITSTIPLTEAGLHLLDGSLIQGSGIYSAFVDYIANLVTDYPDLFETEANWQTSVNTYGVCGKFVYDSVNNTVRLPKITEFIEGTTDLTALGDLVQAGLPNITGYAQCSFQQGAKYNTCSGAIQTYQVGGGKVASTTANYIFDDSFRLDASLSNEIYGNSNTVQPQSIKVLYYICIATSTKTDIQVDIDALATDVNGKLDRDCLNYSNTGYSFMAGASMPISRYIDLTPGASGATYTAPANGYVYVAKNNGTANAKVFVNIDNGSISNISWYYGSGTANLITSFLPIAKGQTFNVSFTATGAWALFRFVYAKGSESEVN